MLSGIKFIKKEDDTKLSTIHSALASEATKKEEPKSNPPSYSFL